MAAKSTSSKSFAVGFCRAEWSGIFDKSSLPNFPKNVLRQASSDSSAEVWPTSRLSTETQGEPGRSTANAKSPSSTAGRWSQSQNFILSGSVGNPLLIASSARHSSSIASAIIMRSAIKSFPAMIFIVRAIVP